MHVKNFACIVEGRNKPVTKCNQLKISTKKAVNMNNFISQLNFDLSLIQANIPLAGLMILGLWIINIVNSLLGYRLNILGIYPRHIFGLIGIPCAPFLHGSFSHLFFNSIPLIVLLDFMLINGTQKFIYVTATIVLLSGTAVWLVGRRALHVGASSVIMGYWGYLLVDAYRHPSILTIILAIVCVYYFGSLLLSLFPREERVSWEGHVFGFLAGLIAVYLY